MATLTEDFHAGAFIVSEANGHRSRESVTIASGQNLKAGAVLGKITASGKYAAYDNAATDGTETAAAVLWDAVDASGGDKPGAIIARDAEVATAALVFAAGQDSTAQTAALADLKAVGIIARS